MLTPWKDTTCEFGLSGAAETLEEYITVAEGPGIHQLQVRQVIHSAAIKGIIIRP